MRRRISGRKDSQHYVSKVVGHFSGELDIKQSTNKPDDTNLRVS